MIFLEVNGTKLREKDLVNLMRHLQTYSYKWNPIGLSLGFTPHELCTISCMVTLLVGAPMSYLQELLSQWVQWPTEEHQNNPTLEALCTALCSSLVGLGSLAEEVEKEMKQCNTGKIVSYIPNSSLFFCGYDDETYDEIMNNNFQSLERRFLRLES